MLARKRFAFCWMIVFLFPSGNAQTGTQTGGQVKKIDADAPKHFEKGKKLIENNCIDCTGGTQAGMEQGIREVEAALQSGYRNPKAAYELLSDAYADMSTYTGRNPAEEKAYTAKRQQIDHKLFAMYPEDPDVLQRYENSLGYTPGNDGERMKVLKRLVKIKPTPGSKFGLGIMLMQQHNVSEGLPLVRSAIMEENDAEAMMNYVGGFVDQLGALGCPLASAALWNEKAYTAFDKATRGAGDPNALPEFKKAFSAELERVSCAIE